MVLALAAGANRTSAQTKPNSNNGNNTANNTPVQENEELFNNINENFENSNEANFLKEETKEFKGELNHPKAASRWRTRELIMTSNITMKEEIESCKNELIALNANALSPETLLSSRNLLTQSIVENVEAYHWCFYLSMLDLDNKLDAADINMNFTSKYGMFVQRMKALWILARALDAAIGSKKYFGYLRRRYKDISQGHFGRSVEVISAPLGDLNRTPPSLIPKSAGSYLE